jgi:hypothetical protein
LLAPVNSPLLVVVAGLAISRATSLEAILGIVLHCSLKKNELFLALKLLLLLFIFLNNINIKKLF